MLTGFPMIVLGRLAYPSCTCIKIAMSAGLEDFSNPLHHPVVPLCIQIIKGGVARLWVTKGRTVYVCISSYKLQR